MTIKPISPIQSLLQNLWMRLLIAVLLLGIAAIAFHYGIRFRRFAWDQTYQMHYGNDVASGYGWGGIATHVGLTNVYDLYAAGRISGPNALDYTPLRLTVVYLWARWANVHFPNVRSWHESYDLTQPMLQLNMIAELISSVLVFLLIRLWTIRMDDANHSPIDPPAPFRGVVRGFIGAAFFWFNPTVVWDGHAFPQWDVWNAPFFLGAALLASLNIWFATGLCIVTGAFFKGQILLVAPLFLIWPLVQLNISAAVRFICGFVLGLAMLALPWFNIQPVAIIWYGLLLLAITLLAPFVLRFRISNRWLIPMLLITVPLAWPWTSQASPTFRFLALAIIGGVALLRFAPPRVIPSLYALAAGCAILLMIPLYNASTTCSARALNSGREK